MDPAARNDGRPVRLNPWFQDNLGSSNPRHVMRQRVYALDDVLRYTPFQEMDVLAISAATERRLEARDRGDFLARAFTIYEKRQADLARRQQQARQAGL